MAHGNLQSNSILSNDKDPLTAATLSLLPGLGQLYNGDRRKGMLFLEASAINFCLLAMIIGSQSIGAWLSQLGQSHRFTVNPEIIKTIEAAHLGSPASLLLLAMIGSFVLYAQRDAYDRAAGMKRKAIYGTFIIDLSEATSGSYVAHGAIIVACFILCLFFIAPRPQIHESVMIEFVEPQIKTIVHPKTNKISTHSSRDSGVHRPDRPVTTSRPQATAAQRSENTATQTSARAQSQPEQRTAQPPAPPQPSRAQAQTTPQPPQPMPVAAAKAAATTPHPPVPMAASGGSSGAASHLPEPMRNQLLAMNTPTGLPTPILNGRPSGTASAGLPQAQATLSRIDTGHGAGLPALPSARPRTTGTIGLPGPAMPQAIGPLSTGAVPSLPPGAGTRTTGGTRPGAPGPQTIENIGQTGLGSAPAAPASSHRGGPTGTQSQATGGPAPVSSSNNNDGNRRGAPEIGMPVPAVKPGTGLNPARTASQAEPSIGAQPADFTDYMARLQRRIKSHWFPTHARTSNQVVVQFSLSTDGALSNLRLHRSSGSAAEDQAALRAVENAAPFAHLPERAPESVDIEFRFDYNVMGGGPSGSFRRF